MQFQKNSCLHFSAVFQLLHAKVPQGPDSTALQGQDAIDTCFDHWVGSGHKVYPKLHSLQCHVVEFLKACPIRMPDVDEQAIEASNSKLKKAWHSHYVLRMI